MSISCMDNEQTKIEPNNSQNNVRNLNESNSDISKTQSNTQIINNIKHIENWEYILLNESERIGSIIKKKIIALCR